MVPKLLVLSWILVMRSRISDFTSMSAVVHKYKARSVSSGAREASSTQRKVYG